MPVEEIRLNEHTIERMAALNHQIYCEMMTANGYTYGPVRDDQKRTRPLLTDYANLPDNSKQSNRNVVISIPEKLRAINCFITSSKSDLHNPTQDEIELLAQMEHERYLTEMVSAGWRYGPKFNETTKENTTLVPWDKLTKNQSQKKYPALCAMLGPGPLSEEEREKDRNQVKNYLTLLERSGFSIAQKNE